MITLTNNQESRIGAGTYAMKITGACELSWNIGDGLQFQVIEGGVFTVAGTSKIQLPDCSIKLTGAGYNQVSLLLMHS